MKSRKPFRFKQFEVDDSGCAMKIGTDGVLLGAWVPVAGKRHILDIGTGSGLVALMLAQRNSQAEIIGIEIDSAAVQQAQVNFERSPWANRLKAVAGDVTAYEAIQKFDLIVSNPPFFENSYRSDDAARNRARHTENLSPESLLSFVSGALEDQGTLALVIPYDQKERWESTAKDVGLYVQRFCSIIPRTGKAPRRSLLLFGRTDAAHKDSEELYIETTGRHVYSEAYQALTKDFYLNF